MPQKRGFFYILTTRFTDTNYSKNKTLSNSI